MKKLTLMSAILSCALLTAAHADVTVDITGATAFRQAALLSIKAAFDASNQPYQYAHDQAEGGFSGATRSIWKGKFGTIPGITTIRTSFNGSVEGIRALVTNTANPTYYTDIPENLVTAAAINGGQTHNGTVGFLKTTAAAQSEIAFSDVSKTVTPLSASPLKPSSPAVGVVVFTMLTNEGSTITNVTSQQFRALLTQGFQPLSLFTGNASDISNVFATGRNDGSGTRTTYLAETGFGVSKPVKQYVTIRSSGNELKAIQLVPVGGVNNPLTGNLSAYASSTGAYVGVGGNVTQSASNASTVWGQNLAGNGGYNSGSALRDDMGRRGASVYVFDENGSDTFGAPVRADLVTFLSLSDAATARSGGAIVCGYNGVKLDGFSSNGTVSAADKAKVTNGLYTAWSYQQMYYRNDITDADTIAVYNGIKSRIGDNLGTAGIPISEMAAARSTDGGLVAPNTVE
jgi:hypothetical protein